MKDKTKILLGVIAGAAAGVAVGIAISDSAVAQNIKETLAEAGEDLNLKLQDLIDDGIDHLDGLREKLASSGELSAGLDHTEG